MCCWWLQFNLQRWAASIHCFPKDPELRKEWADQVKHRQVGACYQCSKHFEDDCFQQYSKLAESLGVGKVRVLLKTGTIPKRLFLNKRNISSSSGLHVAAKRRRTAVKKRERQGCKCTHHCKLYITAWWVVPFLRLLEKFWGISNQSNECWCWYYNLHRHL